MNETSDCPEHNIRRNELLTVLEVAAYLRVSRVTVWRWCQRRIIPASQVGRSWRIHRDDLLRLLRTAQSPSLGPIYSSPAPEDNPGGKPDSEG